MMTLHFAFYLFVAVFAFIGLMRGWRKEMIVAFSIVLGLTLIILLRKYVPQIQAFKIEGIEYFWIRVSIIAVLVFFGYQTVHMAKLHPKVMNETFSDSLGGLIVGAFNGYLLIGSLWLFLSDAQYPFPDFIMAPIAGTPLGDAALKIVSVLPPTIWPFQEPVIYFIEIICFIFLLAVFI